MSEDIKKQEAGELVITINADAAGINGVLDALEKRIDSLKAKAIEVNQTFNMQPGVAETVSAAIRQSAPKIAAMAHASVFASISKGIADSTQGLRSEIEAADRYHRLMTPLEEAITGLRMVLFTGESIGPGAAKVILQRLQEVKRMLAEGERG
jgi:hypothetical protein